MEKNCFICKNIDSWESDEVCHVWCSIHTELDLSEMNSPETEAIAEMCNDFWEDTL